METSEFTYRPRTGPVAAIAVWGLAGLSAAGLAADRLDQAARWAPAVALVCLTAWAVFWAPLVKVGADGLDVRNVTASHRLPWAAIVRIDTRWALTLHTAQGKVTAFAAPAPSATRSLSTATSAEARHLPESSFDAGHSVRPGDLPGTASGDLAWVVRERWERARGAGPAGAATRRWHTATLAAWAALALWTALALALPSP
ncbi:MAG: PH domain-containing protein [Bifidobacteriaceae bacterium]|nr:PH domain-containing protein [Bifidobacteriaceae bacterium]